MSMNTGKKSDPLSELPQLIEDLNEASEIALLGLIEATSRARLILMKRLMDNQISSDTYIDKTGELNKLLKEFLDRMLVPLKEILLNEQVH